MELFKRILALVLCIVMCFAVVACGDSKKNNDDDDDTEESSSKKEEGDPDCKHEWGPEASDNEKACTKETEVTHTCQLCDKVEVVKTIPATGHKLDYDTGKCEICNKKANAKCEHKECTWVTIEEATCTDSGYENKICDKCKFIQDIEYNYSLGHDYEYHDSKDPTCTEDGNYTYSTCSRCDYSTYEDNKIPATGHAYIAGVCKTCNAENESFTMLENVSGGSELAIDAITEIPYTATDAVITTYSASITSTSQSDKYTYTATNDGKVRVWVTEVYSGVRFKLYAHNKLNEEVGYNTWAYNNDGFEFTATAGETYTISVNGYSGTSSYILNIGEPKATVDITDYNKITDKIEFTGQRIVYTFTPATTGKYRFGMSEITSGNCVSLSIRNRLDEEVGYDSYCYNEEGATAELSAGETYTIYVSQRSGLTNYIMSIGTQKDTVDVTDYTTVKDSIQYSSQTNIYTFTPAKDGAYRFSISGMTDNSYVQLYLYNYLGENVKSDSYCYNGEGLSVDLKAGQVYTIKISHSSGYTAYTLNNISEGDPVAMSSNNGYSDGFIYDGQKNVYTFTATAEGKHIVAISGIADEYDNVEMDILDSNGNTVDYDYSVYNNDYLTIDDVKIGDVYTITVYEDYGLVNYIISIQTAQ